MLWVKLLGGSALLFCGGLASLLAIRRERKRLASLDAWIELIRFIRTQIDCYLRPLDEILACADPALLAHLSPDPTERDLFRLLRHARALFDEECARLLSSFVRELGDGYREEQVKRCDYYISALQSHRDKLSADLPQKIKLACTLSLCAALCAVILLW